MTSPRFDTYYRYTELTQLLQAYAHDYPELVQIESLGKSHEGRDIWLATVTRQSKGNAGDKPALWVDGNIHSAELVGSMACLYLLDYLVTNDGQNPEVSRCLDTRTFYICPRLNPDGAEWALADTPKIVRSSTRPWPWRDPLPNGLLPEDIDGDGRILSMRIPDPDGHWKIAEDDPRLMVAREPTETGGDYYRLLPEGMVEDYDGMTIDLPPKREGLDLNRNFPCQWRPESEQKGAGPFPASEPETNAAVRFLHAHPNICGGIAFHSYSGVLLRPFSHRPDEEMIPEDLRVFESLAARGSELTGYPSVSAYHGFRYHPREIITGALDDYLYQELGRFSWTVEIWSPQREAGIGNIDLIDWYRTHGIEDDRKLLSWNESELKGKGFVDWYPFDHPQLGKIELGGWDPLYSFWNPPPHKLEAELQRFPAWLIWHNLIGPELAIGRVKVTAVDKQIWKVEVLIHNRGWLPTYLSKQAQEKKTSRGVIVRLALPDGAELIEGQREQELDQLEGRCHKPNSPFGWSGQVSDPTDDRVKVSWVMKADDNTHLSLEIRHDHAGRI
ncbi:MAG: M14 family metallopeptidase, partial [Thiohalophilus sp.]